MTKETLQESKNTVSAENQLPKSEFVKLYGDVNGSPKIMFIGNSITRHRPKLDLGWDADRGMAASSDEKDYVHIVMKEVLQSYPNACFCVTQCATWERSLLDCSLEDLYLPAKLFCPDVIIYRIGENIPPETPVDTMKAGIDRLLKFITEGNRNAEIVFTTNFWENPSKDRAIQEYAKENGYSPAVVLGDLGNQAKYRANGLFEHPGVAHHPGDLGMETMAKRILPQLFEKLKGF